MMSVETANGLYVLAVCVILGGGAYLSHLWAYRRHVRRGDFPRR